MEKENLGKANVLNQNGLDLRTFRMNNIHLAVLESLQKEDKGWWSGYDALADNVYDKISCLMLSEAQLKATLQDLRKFGYVYTDSIYDDEGKLNGSGWFIESDYRDAVLEWSINLSKLFVKK